MPAAAHLALFPQDYAPAARRARWRGPLERAALLALVAAGAALVVGATYASLRTIVRSVESYRLFANSCDAGFAYAPSNASSCSDE